MKQKCYTTEKYSIESHMLLAPRQPVNGILRLFQRMHPQELMLMPVPRVYLNLKLETGSQMLTLRLKDVETLIYLNRLHMPRYPFQVALSQNPRRIRLPSIEYNLQANPHPNVLPYFTAWLIDGKSIGVNTYPRELLMTNLQEIAFIPLYISLQLHNPFLPPPG